jgi:hypothetical protein
MKCDYKTCNKKYSARRTWKALSEFTNIPIATLYRRRPEMTASGVIFYVRRNRFRNKRIMCWFPLVVMAWFVKKGAQGEMF